MHNTIWNYIRSQAAQYHIFLKPSEWLNQIIPILIGTYIFLNPFIHITSIKEICFYLAVASLTILVFINKKAFSLKSPLSLPLGLFILWAFVGLFFAIDKANSIHDIYSHLLRYVLLYYMLINFFKSKKHLVGLSWIVIISTSVFSSGALFYYYHILGHSLSTRFGVIYGARGFIGTHNVNIGFLCLFALLLTLHNLFEKNSFRLKAVLVAALFPLMTSMVLSQNRCFVVALVLSVVFMNLTKKKVLTLLLVSMVVIYAITPMSHRIKHKMFSSNVRIGITYRSFEIIKDYPIFGIGYGLETFGKHLDLKAYNEKLPLKYKLKGRLPDPHNMILDITIRMGLIGLASFLYILFVFSKMCRECIKHGKDDFVKRWGYSIGAVFIAFLVVAVLQPILNHMPEVMLCTIFSMMTILWNIHKETDASRYHKSARETGSNSVS